MVLLSAVMIDQQMSNIKYKGGGEVVHDLLARKMPLGKRPLAESLWKFSF